jgi:hypothetical protein
MNQCLNYILWNSIAMVNVKKVGLHTWLSPPTVVTIAAPSPVVTLTLIPPIMLQT